VLALSALQNHDKLGLMLFSDRVEKFLRPRKGRAHALRIIREIQGARSTERATRLEDPLQQLRRLLKRRAVIFLVSDFLGAVPVKELALLNRRHDLIALRVQDPAEMEFPAVGLIELVDAESGARAVVDSSGRRVRRRYRADQEKRLEEGRAALARAGVETVTLTTGQSFVEPLMEFFQRRAR